MVFSFMTWGAPVWAACGLSGLSAVWGISLLRALMCFGAGFGLLSRTGLPTFIAALAWQRTEKDTSVMSWPVLFLPLTATALFVVSHGMHLNSLYALYWVAVPVVYSLLPRSTRSSYVTRALVSTMAAHAVGALIVLFAGLPVAWFAIMPKVLFERCVAIAAMSSIGYAVDVFVRVVRARVA